MDILADEYIRSDHMPILLTFRQQTDTCTAAKADVNASTSHTRWRTHAANWSWFAAYLTETVPSWTATHSNFNTTTTPRMTQRDIDRCWSQLHNIINNAANRCIGTSVVTLQSEHWWSRDPAIPSLHTVYRAATDHYRRLRRRRAGSVSDAVIATARANSQHAKRAFQHAAAAARGAASDDMAASLDDALLGRRPKLLWSQLARIRRHKRTPLPSFPDAAGFPPHTPIQALNNMARHLQSVSSLAGHAPSPAAARQHDTVRSYMRSLAQRAVPVHATVPFTRDDVVRACSSFRLNTALGSDRVSPYFLKYGGAALHSALFLLFSLCSRHGLMPSFWKHGLVVPLYKGDGDINDPNNYRPICITSVVARVYERLHVAPLLATMSVAGIPTTSQFGFTRQRSTHDAIFRLLSKIVDCIMSGDDDPFTYAAAVFIDISKAYDKVWIDGLLYKLHHDLHITGPLYHMLHALLTERSIQVIHSNEESDTHFLAAGVPQGSILAPFLFLIYIHGITEHISALVCPSLFADDIAVCATASGDAGMPALQQSLDRMTDYAQRWKLTFSAKKTNVVFFRPPLHEELTRTPAAPSYPLTLSGFTVAPAQHYTYLGVLLDQYLSFEQHIAQLIATTTTTSNLIARLCRPFRLPSFTVIRALVAHVLIPQMTYSFAFMPVPHLQPTWERRLKRNIIRPLQRCLLLPYTSHHESVFAESRLLNTPNLMSLAAAQLVHRWLNTPADSLNQAAVMFRAYMTQQTSNSPLRLLCIHPFRRILEQLRRCRALNFTLPAHAAFAATPRSQLRVKVWRAQYKSFRAQSERSLPRCYSHVVPDLRSLPLYLTLDDPGTAALRARLRFRRALLNNNRMRIGFSDTDGMCTQCAAHVLETTTHLLCRCEAYNRLRSDCAATLASLSQPQQMTAQTVLYPSCAARLLPAVNAITGIYISALHKVRHF
jgi:hypothetical protein